ncbi:MAG TPA: hypothetical protein VN030_11030 [Cellvibrio sp.]|nr:hypothetical protein [Cellvibrio sp.]
MSRLPKNLPSADDLFSHRALELSIALIRNNNPGLASAIKKAISQISSASYGASQKTAHGDMYFNAQLLETLQAHTIGKIVSALTEIGEQALQNKNLSIEYVSLLRNLIDDWVQLTEWILKNSSNSKRAHG